MKLICEIFKSTKKEGMYLYVKKADALTNVPAALLEMFGKPSSAMTMLLSEDKKLAHADIEKVLQDLEEKGYYLQLPIEKDDYQMTVHQRNDKFYR